jgi:aminoglycoside phosphotransferase family enzyme/predicted kinase
MTPLVRGLMRPDAYDHPVSEFRLLETHISWVILTGQFAYKLKKPVDLGFVDFTTLERRRHFCEEELRLNRRLTPELYLAVRPIYGSLEHPTFQPHGEPIEFAVQMRQFDQSCLMPAVLERGELRPEQVDRLAMAVADFHRAAAVAEASSPYGTPAAVRAPVVANFDHLHLAASADRLAPLRAWTDAEFERRRDWFQLRRDCGWIRECHGDMHLGNMVLLDGVIRVFDCLEFNPGLRWIDVIAEIAFLVMDLQERGRPDLALRVLNGWLEQIGDYDGLVGWRWYFVYRALVRAKVAALRLAQADVEAEERAAKHQELQAYLDLAQRWTEPRPTSVIIMHGVSGSGKSYVAQRICERFGAVRLRADVERKRLFGLWGAPGPRRLTGAMYSPEVTDVVYREVLAGHIPPILTAGFSAVVDATCLRRAQRTLFREAADRQGVPWLIVDVRAGRETLRRRISERQTTGTDPSDADFAIVERQLADREPLQEDEFRAVVIVDTESADWPAALDAELRRRLPEWIAAR